MATYWLLNCTRAGINKRYAGESIDDAVEGTQGMAAITQSGGQLYSTALGGNATVAAAALIAQQKRLNAVPDHELDGIMLGAAAIAGN